MAGRLWAASIVAMVLFTWAAAHAEDRSASIIVFPLVWGTLPSEADDYLPSRLTEVVVEVLRASDANVSMAGSSIVDVAPLVGCRPKRLRCLDQIARMLSAEQLYFGRVEIVGEAEGTRVRLTSFHVKTGRRRFDATFGGAGGWSVSTELAQAFGKFLGGDEYATTDGKAPTKPRATPGLIEPGVGLASGQESASTSQREPGSSSKTQPALLSDIGASSPASLSSESVPASASDLSAVTSPGRSTLPAAGRPSPAEGPFSRPSWWVVGGGAVVAAAGTGVLALAVATKSQVVSAPTETVKHLERLEQLERRGRRYSITGSTLLLVGGAALVSGLVWLMLDGRNDGASAGAPARGEVSVIRDEARAPERR